MVASFVEEDSALFVLLEDGVGEDSLSLVLEVDDRAGRSLALVGASSAEDLWTVAAVSSVVVDAFAAAFPGAFMPIEASISFQVADAYCTEVEAVAAELCAKADETFDVCVASQTVSVLCAKIRS